MSTVFFLGAGASKPDGIPLTGQLMGAVASFVVANKKERGPLRLFHFLNAVYGLDWPALRRVARSWDAFVDRRSRTIAIPARWPSITDVLSTLDIAIRDEFTLGTYRRSDPEDKQLAGNELRRVRRRLVEALGWAFKKLEGTPTPHADSFVNALTEDDVVITTNWDALIDFAIRRNHPKRRIDYSLPTVELVDLLGDEIEAYSDASPRQQLLKIHGSMNWLACPRCGKHYANLHKIIIPTENPRHPYGRHRRCDICEAELDGVIETPTLLKAYSSGYMRSLWLSAVQALARADRWVFCGYSLPTDDAWISTLLLRALTARADVRRRAGRGDDHVVEVTVYIFETEPQARAKIVNRYRAVLALAKLTTRVGGFEELIADLRARRRRRKPRR